MPSNRNAKYADAQREVLARIRGCELALADLYEAIAARLPAMEGFWRGIAREELGHAAMLGALELLLDRGILFENVGRFDTSMLAAYVRRVRAEIESLGTTLTVDRALTIALACESTPLESGFFKVVESDAPEYQMIAGHLDQCTREHVQMVASCLARVRSARHRNSAVPTDGQPAPVPDEDAPEPFGWLG